MRILLKTTMLCFFTSNFVAIFERNYQNIGSKCGRKKANFWSKCGRRSLKRGGRLIQ